eukprot:11780384-Karenia_brevis.AAC.1
MDCAKTVGTPGVAERQLEDEAELDDMAPEHARNYRSSAARANYLAADRPDIQFAVKQIAKSMSAPKVKDEAKLKRLA